MRKIILYIASSLNGKIAERDGSVSWLDRVPPPEDTDYGYASFYESIDTTLQGASTYDQIISWGIDFPYKDKKNYVLTRQKDREDTEFVSFISQDHTAFIEQLKQEQGKDIWLIGGGQVNTLLLNAGLIDEIIIFMMPIILNGGIDVFDGLPKETQLDLISSKSYSSGAVELIYNVKETS